MKINKITHFNYLILSIVETEGGGQEEEWYSETIRHKQEEESKDGECARIDDNVGSFLHFDSCWEDPAGSRK